MSLKVWLFKSETGYTVSEVNGRCVKSKIYAAFVFLMKLPVGERFKSYNQSRDLIKTNIPLTHTFALNGV